MSKDRSLYLHSDTILERIQSQPRIPVDFWNLLSNSWVLALLRANNGNGKEGREKGSIEEKDLFLINTQNSASEISKEFNAGNIKELKESLGKIGGWRILWIFIGSFVSSLISLLIVPLLIEILIEKFGEKSGNRSQIISYGIILYLAMIVDILGSNYLNGFTKLTTKRLETGIKVSLFKKSFNLSPKSVLEFNNGMIVNIVNQDSNAEALKFKTWLILLRNTASLVIALISVYSRLGMSTLVVIGFVVLSTLFTFLNMAFSNKYLKEEVKYSDKRISLFRELLYGFRFIKFRSLEKMFRQKLLDLREKETKQIKKEFNHLVISQVFGFFALLILPFITFWVYSLLGNELKASVVFSSIIPMLAVQEPLLRISNILKSFYLYNLWRERYQSFIFAEEKPDLENREEDGDLKEGIDDELAIQMKNCNFKRPGSDFKLQNLDLKIKKGALVGIVGGVGSGKSTLISALLGQIDLEMGLCKVNGSISYCSQIPWIQSKSIEDNVVFTNLYDYKELKESLRVTCLDKDIQGFSHGLGTMIGENGVTLSGGQKSRLALARAVYNDSDIYLLDEPLSTLDPTVSGKVFQYCIKEKLKDKTVLIATHQLQYLEQTDMIIMMKDGKIARKSTFQELIANESEFGKILKEYEGNYKEQGEIAKKEIELTKLNSHKLFEKEKLTEARIEWKIFKQWIQAGGGWKVYLPFMLICLMVIVSRVFSEIWLSIGTSEQKPDLNNFFLIYGIINVFSVVFYILYNLYFLNIIFISSLNLHKLALDGILNTTITWIDSQPIGRLINRFTNDANSVHTMFMNAAMNTLLNSFFLVSSVIVMTYTNPYLIFIILIIFFINLSFFNYYKGTYIQLKKLTSIQKSYLDSVTTTIIEGISTINAFKKKDKFIELFNDTLDLYEGVNASVDNLNSWVNIRINLVSTSLILITIIFARLVWADSSSSSVFGLMILVGIEFSESIHILFDWLAEFESEFEGIETLLHYSHHIPKERQLYDDSVDTNVWPSNGKIQIEGLEVRYPSRPDHAVITNLSLTIEGGNKIGIVGRTGSGKSTLALALFRLIEAHEGKIYIDDVDISKIDLHTLRSRIEMIPQDPTLYQGTIRTNLDPENQYKDEELWEIIEKIGFRDYVQSTPLKLETVVEERGENFSIGQRSLLCLGRSILKRPKILVMDEATASIDYQSDFIIQSNLKEEFKETTIISIAHRLQSISRYDKIIVLQDGRVIEFDTPLNLVNRADSIFKKIIEDSGPANAKLIIDSIKK